MRLCFFVICIISSFKISFSQARIEGDELGTQLLYIKMDAGSDSIGVLNFLNKSGLKPHSFLPFAYGHPNLQLSKIYKLQYVDYLEAVRAKEVLAKSNLLEFVEFAPVNKTSYTPNDLDARQWYLGHIQAPNAWNVGKGIANIRIAIVDDAVDINHPDLKNSCYKNLGEIPSNGIDDDANGYIDDYDGWQAYYRTGDPSPPTITAASFSHGTHCAGIAAAETDNNLGIASIGFGIKIIPVSCSDKLNPGTIAAGYEGIIYAADAGAQIISLSWGSYTYSLTAKTVIDYAISKGCILVAAAGNDNVDFQVYPAAYNGVISVAATDENDRKATFSNYGTWIDISAPGVKIWSTLSGTVKYGYNSGTSMATPLVAGLCGLMLSKNPKFSSAEIESCLKSSAYNLNSKNPAYLGKLGGGRLDAEKALNCVKPISANFTSDRIKICKSQAIQFLNKSSANATVYKWTFNGGSPASSNVKNPAVTYNSIGIYSVKLVVGDGVNFDSVLYATYVNVYTPTVSLIGATQTIKYGQQAILKVQSTGIAPWRFVLNDGNKNDTVENIYDNTYYHLLKPLKNTTYTISSAADSSCNATVAGKIVVFVDTLSHSCDTINGQSLTGKFGRLIEGGGNEVAHQIIRTKDNNYMIIGTTSAGVAAFNDIFIIKLDRNGKIIWSKTYGTSNEEYGVPLGLIELIDSSFIGFGSTRNGYYEGIYFRIDKKGKLLWLKRAQSVQAHDHWRCAARLSNSELFIGGTSGINNLEAAQMMRIDTSGNIIWSKSHDLSSDPEHYIDIIVIRNSVYWCGHTPPGNGGYTSLLSKTTIKGKDIFKKEIDYTVHDAFRAFIETEDSAGFICVATASASGTSTFGSQDLTVTRVDTSGKVVWGKIIGGTGSEEMSSIIRVGKKYYITGSTKSFDGGKGKLFVICMDINGNINWTKIYGKTGDDYSVYFLSKLITPDYDGGLVISGTRAGSNSDIFLLKLNSCGESTCENKSISFSVKDVKPSVSDASLPENVILTQKSSNITTGSFSKTITERDNCPNKSIIQPCKLTADFFTIEKCLKDSFIFYNASIDLSNSKVLHYEWIIDDSIRYFRSQVLKHRFKKLGDHSVRFVVATDTPSFCSDTITKTININDNFKGRIIQNKKNPCKGDSIALVSEVYCGVGNVDYTWSPNLYIDNVKSPSPKIAPPTSRWYYLLAKDGNSSVFRDSIYININSNCCKFNSSFIQPINACIGNAISIVNKSTNAVSVQSKWNLYYSNQIVHTSTNSNYGPYTPLKAGFYEIKLIVSGTGCASDTTSASLTMNPLPYINPGRDSMLCKSDTVTLGSEPVEWLVYNWSPKKYLNSDTLAMPISIPTDSVKYTLKVSNKITGCISSKTVSLALARKPKVGADTTFCSGDSITIKSDVPFGIWENGLKSTNRKIKTPGIFIYSLINSNCTLSDTILIDTIKTPVFTLGPDKVLCDLKPILIGPNLDTLNLSANWSDGYPYFTRFENESKSYLLTISNKGCNWSDSIAISVLSHPKIGSDTFMCEDDSIQIYANIPDGIWDNGLVSQSRIVKQPGLYIYTLDKFGCKISDSILIAKINAPQFSLGPDKYICNDIPIQIGPNIDSSGLTSNWQDNITYFKRLVNLPNEYILNIKNNYCDYSDTVNVYKILSPMLSFPTDTTVCYGEIFTINVGSSNAKYIWNTGSRDSILNISKPGYYSVIVDNPCGIDSGHINIQFKNCRCKIYLPTAFTPDGNSRNEFFISVPDCIVYDYTLRIYNRWGEKLFESTDPQKGWDGFYLEKMSQEGVYVYILTGKMFQNGILTRETFKGTFHLLR